MKSISEAPPAAARRGADPKGETRPGLSRRRALRRHALPIAAIIVIGYLVLAPLVRLQLLALADGGAGYARGFGTADIARTILTTLLLGLGSLVIGLVFGAVLAWYSIQLPPRARWMASLPILPIVVPPVASMIGWGLLLAPNSGTVNRFIRSLPFWSGGDTGPIDVFTVPWIVFLTALGLTSFVYVFLRAGLLRVNYELVEAGRTAGDGPVGVFFRILLPVVRPSLIYGGAVALLLGLGQFTAPLLLGSIKNVKVLTTEVYFFANAGLADYGAAAAVASPLLLVGFGIVALQRMLLGEERRFVTDGGKTSRYSARRSPAAVVVIGLFSAVVALLPLLALIAASLSPFWTGQIDVSTWSLKNFRELWDTPTAVSAVQTSLVASGISVLVSLPIGYVLADILHRRSLDARVRAIVDILVSLPLGVPAVVFGAGFLFTYTAPPFVLYGTPWVLVVVYVTLMLPFATRMQLAARMSLGDSYQEAARVSGAGPVRTHLQVVIPMIRGSLGGAAALIFVLLTHEFAASLLVRSTRTQVMGTTLYDLWLNVSYPLVAAMGLVMCLVTAAGVILAVRLGGSKALESL
ncbi:iron ABC transporter permease [Nonomuraea sp. C10]|uniref:ABC transporter permease n=1 Tax=Nonomuraea sp. C10 TaxID=2600577 RepID=UPI0011CD7339|nr:ABC transporter permease subunit [Nonomuraea sp. C10]TXK34428.1 iron ABC transporter permease [Nonomuraea sp. C10]